ncbi:hypothetical protein NC796_26395, partial [Aliifodinibius sp. S!AR15-10]|uniref:hypothetical protein n=1 Tax=Aliifodinibius sp. S!AR15-10 TaxID=2950437 RepID=UPI002857082B|nr:hypothetical protein [Aliifodinibius sp. S!AR15-10]
RNHLQNGNPVKEPPQDLNEPYHPGKYNSATNDFTILPSTIGDLKNLKVLELGGSSIPEIPSEIGNATALEALYFSWSEDLVNQQIPSTIGNLTNLKHFHIQNAGIVGEMPSSMSNLTLLSYVRIGNHKTSGSNFPMNNLTGSLPDFSRATNMRLFAMQRNSLTGDWPSYWNNGSFTKLFTLRGDYNNFTGTLHGFDKLPAMKSFGIYSNSISGNISVATDLYQGIIIFSIGNNNITGNFPSSGWPNFWDLRHFDADNNGITGSISCEFWQR